MNRRTLLQRFAAIAAAVAVAPAVVSETLRVEAMSLAKPFEQNLCGGNPSIGQRQIAREYRALCTNGVSGIQALDEYEQAAGLTKVKIEPNTITPVMGNVVAIDNGYAWVETAVKRT